MIGKILRRQPYNLEILCYKCRRVIGYTQGTGKTYITCLPCVIEMLSEQKDALDKLLKR